MVLINFIILVVLILCGVFIVDAPSMLMSLIAYFIGYVVVSVLNKKDKSVVINIYSTVFTVGFSYALLCYAYMNFHDYEFILSTDAIGYYIPTIESLLAENSIDSLWSDANILSRFSLGYFSYSFLWGKVAEILDADLYFTINISTLILYALSIVVLFKIFIINGFNEIKSRKYSIIVALFSIIFFYSSQVLRDIHILLLYLLTIYLSLKPKFEFTNIIKLFVLVILVCIFRVESGLFLLTSIAIYMFGALEYRKNRSMVLVISVIIFSVIIGYVLMNINSIMTIISDNNEHYSQDVGSGVIGTLQSVPFFGDLASIVYNAIQPLPFWSKLSPTLNARFGGEAYNILGIVRMSAAYLNLWTLIAIFHFLAIKKIRIKVNNELSKGYAYQLIAGLIFLYIQSAVIDQRRLMAYYCVFYVFAFMIYNKLSNFEKQQLNRFTFLAFVFLQIAAVIFLA